MRMLLTLAIGVLAAGTRADVIVDTFGPASTFDHNGFYSWNQQPTTLKIGFPFLAAAGGGVTGLTAAVYHGFTIPAAGVRFELYGDGGGVPGPLLGSWLGATPSTNYTTFPPPLHLALDGSVQVTQGQTYYFVVGTDAPVARIDWFLSPGVTGTQVYQNAPGPWLTEPQPQPFGAFRLETIPEPAVGALALLAAAARRRRGPC